MTLAFCANDGERHDPVEGKKKKALGAFFFCGDGEIRTRDTVSRIHTFQACSFNHSDTSPWGCKNKSIGLEAEDFFGICGCDPVHLITIDPF